MTRLRRLAVFALVLTPAHAAAQALLPLTATDSLLARAIFQELIEIVTTDSAANTYRAAQAMADHLITAGFPATDVHVLGPDATHGNLVVRYRGRRAGTRPFIVMSHLDVVPARRATSGFR